jgi:hypothetical protein
VWVRKEFQRVILTSSLEIVFGGPAESKGAKRAVAPGYSAQLGQENQVRKRLRETDVQSGSIEADREMRSDADRGPGRKVDGTIG